MRWALVAMLACVPSIARADDAYLLDHPDARWWLSGQLNAIAQAQPGFHAVYSGENSLRPDDHAATSFVATIYASYLLSPTSAIVATVESAGGGGLSDALGVGGFTNLDVVRNPTLGPTPYFGRVFLDVFVPIDEPVAVDRSSASPFGDAARPGRAGAFDRDPLHPFAKLPPRRIELRAGKLSTVDAFDVNAVGSDSHLQFMNWTLANNGAYDYAADTRGYTLGAIVEYVAPLWTLRFGELLMPTVANGIDYDTDLAKARGENLELEIHDCLAGYPGRVRVLGFLNHAAMGSYADAIAAALDHQDDLPDITKYRLAGRRKYGFGLNAEQELGAIRAFARVGWNDGANESFAYTEVDDTIALGADIRGAAWHRSDDKLGLAVVSNGLSDLHARYLALGGHGFLLGDGTLHYGREDIVELYYTARAYRGVSPALDVQLVDRPGFNRDRGPVVVGSLRLHVEL